MALVVQDTAQRDVGGGADPEIPSQAVAVLIPTEGSQVSGVILLQQQGEGVRVQGKVWGLTPGMHGFHIHQFGDLRSPTGDAAGGHYSPDDSPHGAPGSAEHHAGDLGNIEANQEGVADVDATFDFFQIHHVLGRAIVVHADADDLRSQPSGAAGARLAVGVIGIANPSPPAAQPQPGAAGQSGANSPQAR
jgi:Cu-Zn family superoxide dismutase